MYFPYLRGKQYELIALRKLTPLMSANKGKISPIIEPVKKSMSSLAKCLGDLADTNINFNVVMNPGVGELVGAKFYDDIIACVKGVLHNYSNYQIAFLIESENSWKQVSRILSKTDFYCSGITLIHNTQSSDVSNKLGELGNVKYNLINYSKTSRRYHRSFPENTKVSFDDYFNSKPKNVDYVNIEDEMFSDEYSFYSDESFSGFSDFLTLGSPYSDSGFMPYAVAIHLTYCGKEGDIRVRHFVSDSNEDNEDTPGKFAEALDKLIRWTKNNTHSTAAIEEFKEFHKNEHFPGLGTVKRLSIENHIELVLKLI